MQPSILITFADRVELLLKRSGQAIAWVYIALIIAIISQIILRRGFHNGMIALEELQWHLYAIGVMFGMVYTQVSDAHVRVDLFHQKMSPIAKHWVEIFGLLFLVIGRGSLVLAGRAFKFTLKPCFSNKGFKALAQRKYPCSLKCSKSLL